MGDIARSFDSEGDAVIGPLLMPFGPNCSGEAGINRYAPDVKKALNLIAGCRAQHHAESEEHSHEPSAIICHP